MKRFKTYLGLILLFTVFLINGCKKKEEKTASCEELSSKYASAVTAFITSPTEATCNALEEAVVAYVNGCAILTPAEKQELQDSLEDNDCAAYN